MAVTVQCIAQNPAYDPAHSVKHRPSPRNLPLEAVKLGMSKKISSEAGLRIVLPEGTDGAVAVDALVVDLLRGDVDGALHDLHEPHNEQHEGHLPSKNVRRGDRR